MNSPWPDPGSAPPGPPRPLPARVLITGPEEVLAERALAHTLAEISATEPDAEVLRFYPAGYLKGDLIQGASPSLFGGVKVLVVHDLDESDDELLADVLGVIPGVDGTDARLIVLHKGGQRGKRVLDELRGSGTRLIEAPALRTDRDKADFAAHEFRAARRKATAGAVQALVEAVGKDVRELAAACQQLVSDTNGTIDEAVVETYHGGKVEATGFKVADAAMSGDSGEALRLLRHALAVGVDPVPIVAVLASSIRQLIRVGSAGRGRSSDLARELSLAPWQIDKARRQLQGWTAEGLGRSLSAVAAADADVKGGSRDPVYAVERAILVLAAEHGAR